MTFPGSAVDLAEQSRLGDGKKTRMGMIYAILAAPSLGLAFGLLGSIVGAPPFNAQAPTGAFTLVAVLQVPFGVLAIALFLTVTGTWRDTGRVLGHRVSWWNLFVAVGGFVGDICFAAASGLIGGALAGAIGGLAGVVGAIVAATLYRERILRPTTLIGLVALAVGIWLAVSEERSTLPRTASTSRSAYSSSSVAYSHGVSRALPSPRAPTSCRRRAFSGGVPSSA